MLFIGILLGNFALSRAIEVGGKGGKESGRGEREGGGGKNEETK